MENKTFVHKHLWLHITVYLSIQKACEKVIPITMFKSTCRVHNVIMRNSINNTPVGALANGKSCIEIIFGSHGSTSVCMWATNKFFDTDHPLNINIDFSNFKNILFSIKHTFLMLGTYVKMVKANYSKFSKYH